MKLSLSSVLPAMGKGSSRRKKENKSTSISRSEAPSFDSSSSTRSSISAAATPNSVLPPVAAVTPPAHTQQKITRQELETVLQRLDIAEDQDDLFLDADDGCIDPAALGPAGDEEEELKDAFRVFDENGDGKISPEELFRVLAALGDDGLTVDDCRHMIGAVDSDGDGLVCFGDFAKMMGAIDVVGVLS